MLTKNADGFQNGSTTRRIGLAENVQILLPLPAARKPLSRMVGRFSLWLSHLRHILPGSFLSQEKEFLLRRKQFFSANANEKC